MNRFLAWCRRVFAPRPKPKHDGILIPGGVTVGVAEEIGGANDGKMLVCIAVGEPGEKGVMIGLPVKQARDLYRRIREAAKLAEQMSQ